VSDDDVAPALRGYHKRVFRKRVATQTTTVPDSSR